MPLISLLVITPDGNKDYLNFTKPDITIGRTADCDVVVPKKNVSKRHARIYLDKKRFFIMDLNSTNGTLLNGNRIENAENFIETDIINIGGVKIQQIKGDSNQKSTHKIPDLPKNISSPPQVIKPETSKDLPVLENRSSVNNESKAPVVTPSKNSNVNENKSIPNSSYANLLRSVHERLLDHMDLRRMDILKLNDHELKTNTEQQVTTIVNRMSKENEIPSYINTDDLITDVINEALGLGPLESFLMDDSISEIMVNHSKQIYIEREGKITLSDKTFSSNQAILGVIERIVAPLGRRIDESSPLVDARLKDGSRVNAIIPPLALKGPCITIRKFKKDVLQITDLIKYGSVTPEMGDFLQVCVEQRKNIVISGGTGSGKTTTLNLMSSFIPNNDRIVTIEDAAELQLPQDHLVSLESRPANLEGKGEIAIRDLVRNSLRMRPDRIVVGECRGGEALDMLQAMNTGHDGSLTTVHANGPRDALARLETMVLMSGMELPIKAIREQVSSAIDVIVQQTRFSCGSRKITHITEVTGMEVDIITLQDIFLFKQTGFDSKGNTQGYHTATGFIPSFFEDMKARGFKIDMSLFGL